MKKNLMGFILVLAALCCKKYHHTANDIGGQESWYLRGRILLLDNLSGQYSYTNGQQYPLGGKIVTLDYFPADTTNPNHLFVDTADANGYFAFNNLIKGRQYFLQGLDTGASGLLYRGWDTVTGSAPGIDSELLLVQPSPVNTGVIFYITDSGRQGPLPGVNACIFTNPTLPAPGDTICVNSVYQLITNLAGKAIFVNTSPGTYYPQFVLDLATGHSVGVLDTITIAHSLIIDTILIH